MKRNKLEVIIGVSVVCAIFVGCILWAYYLETNTEHSSRSSSTRENYDYKDDLVYEDGEWKFKPKNKELPPAKMWRYTDETNEMTGTIDRWATLNSENYIHMDFPYSGETYVTLTIRDMKRYGTDVILESDRGQIFGNEFKGENYVMVKFDDEPEAKYMYNEASSGDSKVVFLRNKNTFIKKAKKAKQIMIEIPFFREGRRVFYFKVDSVLVW